MTLKELIARMIYRVNPFWDEIPWNRKRDSAMRTFGLRPKRFRRANPFDERPTHVLVIPQHGPHDHRFAAGERNFYYEAQQLLMETLGDNQVSVFEVSDTEDMAIWIPRLIHVVDLNRITHILTHIEIDPGNQVDKWNWDAAFVTLLENGWDGVLLGVNFDSAFKWIRAKSRRLARISPQFLAVDICESLDSELVRGRVEVGPVNMPVSHKSLELVNQAISPVQKIYDVSFIGVLYPYRVQLINELRSRGIDVAVNPHRPEDSTNPETSRVNQPSWLDYMRGLASSHITINFSQSSAGPYEQLKTRVIEATLAGTFLLTDDQDRTRLFFEPNQFGTFTSVGQLPDIIERLLADRSALNARAKDAQLRAREIAVTNFWGAIDQVLRSRGLPPIFD